MSTGVFANGLEISCKSSSGKSPASFPDPCFSPPSPSAGWIVIPYANTAKASTATNTSKTVFIGGKPVMLKDKSYFKTSTGDEGAAGPKGVSTGTKKGKAYYRSWSSDVKIEGYNVCRHTDQMTHNHNPVQGNTGTWHFLSEKTKGKCRKAINEIEDECEVDKRDQERFVDRQKGRNRRRVRQGKSKNTIRPKTWKDNHCRSLLVKPRADQLKRQLTKFNRDAKEMYHDLTGEAWDLALDRAKEQATNTGERMVTKWVGGLGCTVLTPAATAVCETAITIWNVLDGIYSFIAGGVRMVRAANDVREMANILSSIPKQLKDVKEAMRDPVKRAELNKKLIDDARKAANEDDCIRARKCMLVPYNGDRIKPNKPVKIRGQSYYEVEKYSGDTFTTKIGMGTSGGCCPGQTGHHVIPHSWAKKAGCKSYSHGGAPVVCVEGISQNDGTHKSIHYNLNERLKDESKGVKTEFTQAEIIEIAAKSHQDTFPKSGDCMICIGSHPCDKECIKAQLEEYYDCGKFTPKEIPQSGGDVEDGF